MKPVLPPAAHTCTNVSFAGQIQRRFRMTFENGDAESSTCPQRPAWPIILNLACDCPSNDYRMADMPILPIGRYEVRAVAGGRYQAWSNVRQDIPGRANWYNRYHLVSIGNGSNGSIGIQQLGSGSAYSSPAEALNDAKPYRFEVYDEHLVIFCIRDNGQDNRGGISLQISPVP